MNKQILIIDINNIAYAMYHVAMKERTKFYNHYTNLDYFQYLVFVKIKNIKLRFPTAEIVLAVDSESWRKKYFKYYKARRIIAKVKSKYSFDDMFEIVNETLKDIKNIFPYKVIKTKYAEADDIIGTLINTYGNTDIKFVIVSRDKDFMQLQKYNNVKQYDPITNKFVLCDNPYYYLKSHIIMGDSGDDIPNILSDRDTFMIDNKRQKSCGIKKVNDILDEGLEEFLNSNNTYRKRYGENQKLIELSIDTIPKSIWRRTLNQYRTYKTFDKDVQKNIRSYFKQKKHLTPLTKFIMEFL